MNITTLLNDIASVVHGTTINKIPNVYGHINRAARAVLLDVDPKETQKIVQLSQVFNNVFDYAIPTDVKGDRIIDLRMQAGRDPSEIFVQDYATTFDSQKSLGFSNAIYTQWNTGVKSIRIEAPTLKSPVVVTDTSSLTGWTVTSGAQNLSLDTTNNVAGGGALVFDLAAGSATGSIEISTLNPIDMTTNVNVDTEFFWVYLPTGSAVTSINLKLGSDYTANYYTYTVTTNQQGNAFVNGWNLIACPWASATLVGSPTLTAYDSVQVTFSYNSTLQTGVKFCNLTSNTGYIFELQYYSKYIFRDSTTNAFQETVVDGTDDNKLINLDTESYNLLFNKTVFFIAQALQGNDAQYDATFWDSEYTNALKRYRAQNPSEAIKKGESYYTTPNKSYNRFNPRYRN
jgi:hypothetical protein